MGWMGWKAGVFCVILKEKEKEKEICFLFFTTWKKKERKERKEKRRKKVHGNHKFKRRKQKFVWLVVWLIFSKSDWVSFFLFHSKPTQKDEGLKRYLHIGSGEWNNLDEEDRSALISLYDNTGGENWKEGKQFGRYAHVYVEIQKNIGIKVLRLTDCNLTGEFQKKQQ